MSSEDENWLRQQIIDTGLKMSEDGLSPGCSGNVSCRWGDGMLITPSGMAYADILPGDIVYVGSDGESPPKGSNPSSEWQFHLSAYQTRPDKNAVVHCHSLNATVLACAHKPIPAFHYMVAVAGGDDIPLIPYATFGTKKLADYVARGLKKRDACLMANHGQIAIGDNLESALELAHEVEVLASQYLKVLALDAVHLLDDKQMKEVITKFANYRRNS